MTVIILDIHNEGILSQLLFIHFSSSHDDFIFTSLALMSVMIFFKWALVKENDRLKRLRKLVKKHFRAIQNQNKGLLRQKKELEKLNLKLEKEIRHHTRHIVKLL